MGKNWLHTRANWHFVQFDDETTGRAALFPHRKNRLPWATELEKLLFSINNDSKELSIYRLDHIPIDPIPSRTAMYKMTTCSLEKLQEFVSWGPAESIYSEHTQCDLSENIPVDWLAGAISRDWRQRQLPGWWLIDRGVLNVSFLSDAVDIRSNQSICIEVSMLKVSLYFGSIAENEALDERRIFKVFDINDLEMNRLTKILSTDSAIRLRSMVRRLRFTIYNYSLSIGLPF